MNDISGKIKETISRFFWNYDIQEDDDIFSLGFVNSLFAMQLVMFIEQEFCITIDHDDMDLDNFRTINRMTKLVERKMQLKKSGIQSYRKINAGGN